MILTDIKRISHVIFLITDTRKFRLGKDSIKYDDRDKGLVFEFFLFHAWWLLAENRWMTMLWGVHKVQKLIV